MTAPLCDCFDGYDGEDCSIPLCTNNCTSPDNGECSPISQPPKCVCKQGWTLGINGDCSEPFFACPGRPTICSGKGQCNTTIGECVCEEGYIGNDCSLPECPRNPITNDMCSLKGNCIENGGGSIGNHTCDCDNGWTGEYCSIAVCPNSCSSNGICMDELNPPRCLCNAPLLQGFGTSPPPGSQIGYGGDNCAIIVPDCTSSECESKGGICGNNTNSIGYACDKRSCPPGWRGWDCSKSK